MRHCLLLVLFSLCGTLVSSHAAPVVFTIDSSQSQIKLAGIVAGQTVVEQGPGSLISRYTGTINVEITGSTIQFTGGSVIDALTNGVWQPNVGGGSGSAPADFSGRASAGFITIRGAFRNIVLDVTSALLPLTSGTFNAAALTFAFPTNSTAAMDYDATLTKGSEQLTGISTNKVTNAGTLTTVGNTQRIVVQVDTEYFFDALSQNDSSARLTGQLVATRESGLVIASSALLNNKLVIAIDDTSASLQIQSTTDFTGWSIRAAAKQVAGGRTTFTVDPPTGAIEFFRALK